MKKNSNSTKKTGFPAALEGNSKGNGFLSSRAAVFAAFAAVSLCTGTVRDAGDLKALSVSFLWAVLCSVIIIIFWIISFRFFETPDMMPVSVALNLLPAFAVSIFIKDAPDLTGMMLLCAGLTGLTLVPDDCERAGHSSKAKAPGSFTGIDFLDGEFVQYVEFGRADVFSEIFMPFLCSLIAAACGIYGSFMIGVRTGMHGAGVRMITAALAFMLISYAVSRLIGRDFILSSARMSDPSVLPLHRLKPLRSFLLRRLRFALSMIIAGSVCLLSDLINVRFELGFPYIKYIALILLSFAFAFVHGRRSEHLVQYVTELFLIAGVSSSYIGSVYDLTSVSIAAVLIDLFITSLIFTHNRRLVLSARSRYVAGMPLTLLSVSFIFLIFEVVLEYFNVVI